MRATAGLAGGWYFLIRNCDVIKVLLALIGVGRGFVCASFANLYIRVSIVKYTFTPSVDAVE